MASRKHDPLARRPDESYWQHQSRVIAFKQNSRNTKEPVAPIEAQQHGDYREEFVTEVDSNTKAQTLVNRSKSSLRLMNENGTLSDDQYYAALQIAGVAERIESAVAVRGASMEARVDCSGSGRSAIVESLGAVRMERAYTEWRGRLPMPRRMFVDMVLTDGNLFATARKYGMGWPKAKRQLANALDLWPDIYRRAMKEIDQEDLDAAHRRLTS